MNIKRWQSHINVLREYASNRRSIFPRDSAQALLEMVDQINGSGGFNEESLDNDRKIKDYARKHGLEYKEAYCQLVNFGELEGEVFL